MRSAFGVHDRDLHGHRPAASSASPASAAATSASPASSATAATAAWLSGRLGPRLRRRQLLQPDLADRAAGNDGVLDERQREHAPHRHVRHFRALRLPQPPAGRKLLVHVRQRGRVRVPLHLPSAARDDRHGQRQYRAAASSSSSSTTSAAASTPTAPASAAKGRLQGSEGGWQEARHRTQADRPSEVQARPGAPRTLGQSSRPGHLTESAARREASARGSCEPARQPRAACSYLRRTARPGRLLG